MGGLKCCQWLHLMMARVQDGTWVYKVFMVEVAEVIWLLDPFLPFLFTRTYRPPNLPIAHQIYLLRFLAIFRKEKNVGFV